MPRYHVPRRLWPWFFALLVWWFTSSAMTFLAIMINNYFNPPAIVGIIIYLTALISSIVITIKATKWYKRKFVTPTPPGNARRQYAFPNKPN